MERVDASTKYISSRPVTDPSYSCQDRASSEYEGVVTSLHIKVLTSGATTQIKVSECQDQAFLYRNFPILQLKKKAQGWCIS